MIGPKMDRPPQLLDLTSFLAYLSVAQSCIFHDH